VAVGIGAAEEAAGATGGASSRRAGASSRDPAGADGRPYIASQRAFTPTPPRTDGVAASAATAQAMTTAYRSGDRFLRGATCLRASMNDGRRVTSDVGIAVRTASRGACA